MGNSNLILKIWLTLIIKQANQQYISIWKSVDKKPEESKLILLGILFLKHVKISEPFAQVKKDLDIMVLHSIESSKILWPREVILPDKTEQVVNPSMEVNSKTKTLNYHTLEKDVSQWLTP